MIVVRPPLLPFLAPEDRPGAPGRAAFPFDAHVELLQLFLARRDGIVDSIERLLNARRKPVDYLQNGALLSRHLEDCFFTLPDLAHGQAGLRGQLEEAHWASGFKPRDLEGLHNSLIDPAEMMVRAFHLWTQTQWPGRNGRLRYAHTLFNLSLMRALTLLSMRLWDDGSSGAGERLSKLQQVLDAVWARSPADHPALVKDARWLIQLAQSPATDDLGAYFEAARNIATLPEEDRIEVHRAGVRMAGGHLRSQLHYYSTKKAVPLGDHSLVSNTRTSNALDFALLIQELAPLLDAYEDACRARNAGRRRALADAILQGISPDPELFLNRVELLGAYSMIEHLFVTTDRDGHAVHTPMGRRHVQLIRDYETRIARVAKALYDDCRSFRPVAGTCSPYGILYGFTTDLVEHMAFKTLQREAVKDFSLEDVFDGGEAGAGKLAWVSGWRRLPHVPAEVQKLFEYPQRFAENIFDRLEDALGRRVAAGEANAVAPVGRLFIVPGDDREEDPEVASIPDLPVRYIGASDRQLVAARKADFSEESQILGDRREGRCLLSYRTPGGWVAISKAVLTDVVGTGRDVKVAGLPAAAAGAVKLMCPSLVVLPEHVLPSSARVPGD